MKTEDLIDVALGNMSADLVVKGGKLVNVHTAEIYPADVAIKGDRIAFVGQADHAIGKETVVIDAKRKYLTPGLIEAHQHVAGSHLSMGEFAKSVLPHGTTAIATDFYEIGAVAGITGIKFCLDRLRETPLKVLFVIPMPALYQNEPFGHTGTLNIEHMKQMLEWPECYGLNEAFAPRVLEKDPEMLELIQMTKEKGKVVVGHASEIRGKNLQAWLGYVGSTNDHECVSAEEAVEKARLGIRILLREGSAASDLVRVIKAVTEYKADPRCFAFCTDEQDPLQLVRIGHSDYKIRLAISAGVNPITAIQMGSLNAAECYKIDSVLGSIAPGKIADILLVDSLREFKVDTVLASGKVVARGGKFIAKLKALEYPESMYGTVNLQRNVEPKDFEIKARRDREEVKVRVIGATDGDLITEERVATLKVRSGVIQPGLDQDVLKIAVLERHKASGEIGKGFIQGFGIKEGAIGSTFNPHNEDLVVLGTNDADMSLAANKCAEMGGGFIAVKGGRVLAQLELPLFGLLSDDPLEKVAENLAKVYRAIKEMGCEFGGPFTTLGFMCLPVIIGRLKICCEGVVDVWKGKLVDVIIG